MIVQAFSGTTKIPPTREAHNIIAEVAALAVADKFVTGAAKGIDVLMAGLLAKLNPNDQHLIVIPDAPFDHDGVNRLLADYPFIQTYQMPTIALRPSESQAKRRGRAYRARNEFMVNLVAEHPGELSRLTALPHYISDRSPRSGTWMTVRIAKRLGVPVEIHVLDPVEVQV